MTQWMRARATGLALLSALAAVLTTTGCSSECVDVYDCQNKNGAPPSGMQFACVNEECQLENVRPQGPGPDGGTPDAGIPTTTAQLLDLNAAGLRDPMDTATSGDTVYFSAIPTDGSAPGVYRSVNKGAPERLGGATPFVFPTGVAVSADGATLYIADIGGSYTDGATVVDTGAVYSMPSSGAASPARVATPGLREPVDVNVAANGDLLVSAKTTDGVPGVYRVVPSTGAVTPVAQQGLQDPGGAVEVADGAFWVADHRAGGGRGGLLRFPGGNGNGAAVAGGPLEFGFPAGVVKSSDGSSVMALFLGASSTAQVLTIGAGSASGVPTLTPLPGLPFAPGGFSAPAGTSGFIFSGGEGAQSRIYSLQ
ncbi:hypothetical protein P2318_16680 [Myxococcaceae bacterium GXIMD 01537]